MAFGPLSDYHLHALAGLALRLSPSPSASLQDEAEAEAIYRRVVAVRQQDAKFGHEKLAELIEGLADTLEMEGKNNEAGEWRRRADGLMTPAAGFPR
jgi:hypothetical protein